MIKLTSAPAVLLFTRETKERALASLQYYRAAGARKADCLRCGIPVVNACDIADRTRADGGDDSRNQSSGCLHKPEQILRLRHRARCQIGNLGFARSAKRSRRQFRSRSRLLLVTPVTFRKYQSVTSLPRPPDYLQFRGNPRQSCFLPPSNELARVPLSTRLGRK